MKLDLLAIVDERWDISTNSTRANYRTAMAIHADKMKRWARRKSDDITYALGVNDQHMAAVGVGDQPDIFNDHDRREGSSIYRKEGGWFLYFDHSVASPQGIGQIAKAFYERSCKVAQEKFLLSTAGGLAQAVRREALNMMSVSSITKQRAGALAAAYEMERLARLAEADFVYVSIILKRP